MIMERFDECCLEMDGQTTFYHINQLMAGNGEMEVPPALTLDICCFYCYKALERDFTQLVCYFRRH